jgi:hypothetical protein
MSEHSVSAKSGMWTVIAAGVMFVAIWPVFAVEQAPVHGPLIPAEPIAYNGAFTLVQSDGSGCVFADAPLTSGAFALTSDWLAGIASGTLQGGGSGVRLGLQCGEVTGDMHWQQAYSANFSGSADGTSGVLALTGSLSGSNNVSWQNCKENGEPIACPNGYSNPYTFPIALEGTIDIVGGSGDGAWEVNNITLPTNGDWNVSGPALTPTPTATDTETPTATPTETSTPTETPTPRLDLTVKNVEIVQAIQCLNEAEGDTGCLDNSVPLVSYKHTAVRVYVGLGDTAQEPADGVGARLHGYRNNQEFEDSPLSPVNDRIRALNVPNRGNTNDTLNFRLPHDWLTGNLEVEIEVNPNQAIPEQNYLNNRRRLNLTFADRPIFRVAYIPITYNGTAPSDAIHTAHLMMYKLYPVGYGRLIYTQWPGFVWDKPITDGNATELLAELNRRYILAGSTVDQLAGWLSGGLGISTLGISDPRWQLFCWSSCYGRVTWNQVRLDFDHTLAHEIAHNLGRRHTNQADGCNAKDLFTDWIYSDSTIQEFGFDPLTMQVVSNGSHDIMSYCSPQQEGINIWISPYTYKKLFEGQWAPRQRAPAQAQDYLLVSGVFDAAGGGTLAPAYRFSSTQVYEPPRPGEDACLTLQNDAAATLAEHCFDIEFHNDRTGEEMAQISFALVLPASAGTTHIVLKRNNAEADRLTASAHAPAITISSPTSGDSWTGAQPVVWQASDEDGDALTYALLYRPDSTASWLTLVTGLTQTQYTVNSQELAGGDSATIRVFASDGFNTSFVDSPAFQVAQKGPQPLIISPAPNSEITSTHSLILLGDAYDLEDELLDDRGFQWQSDRDGILGVGRSLALGQLTPGLHTLTLTVTDSEGNQGTASVVITLRATGTHLFLPVVRGSP